MRDAREEKKFVNYCLSFYGRGGMYAFKPPMTSKEAAFAYVVLKRADAAGDWAWGGGDSVDRERARDLVLLKRGKTPVGIGPHGPSPDEVEEHHRVLNTYWMGQ